MESETASSYPSLETALETITLLIRDTASKKGFHALRHSLLGIQPEDDVQVMKDVISEREKHELQNRLANIKRSIAKASAQFQVSYQDILKSAMAKNKSDMMQRQRLERSHSSASDSSQAGPSHLSQTQPPQLIPISSAAGSNLRITLTPMDNSGAPLILPHSPVVVQNDFSLPNPVQLVNVVQPVPITVSLPMEPVSSASLPVSLSSVPPTPPLSTASSTSSPANTSGPFSIGEQRMLRYGRAILKLKHYKRALKYAIWDFQDGVTVDDAATKQGITKEAVQYSINLITTKTGETIEEFKNNRSSNCDVYPGPMSEGYKERVKDGTQRVKQKKCQNLFACAVACDISLFDLMDSLIKELEIETKILSLQPVDARELAPTPTGNDGNLEAHQDDILSDIDEVIRQDSGQGQEVNNTVVVEVTTCDICKKFFYDQQLFQEHVDDGCIDY